MARRHVAAAPAGPPADQRRAVPQARQPAPSGEAMAPAPEPAGGDLPPEPQALQETAGAEPADPRASQADAVEPPRGDPVKPAGPEAGLCEPTEAELAERLLDRVEQMARQMPPPRPSAFGENPRTEQAPSGRGLSPRVRLLLQLLAVAALSALALGLHLLTR